MMSIRNGGHYFIDVGGERRFCIGREASAWSMVAANSSANTLVPQRVMLEDGGSQSIGFFSSNTPAYYGKAAHVVFWITVQVTHVIKSRISKIYEMCVDRYVLPTIYLQLINSHAFHEMEFPSSSGAPSHRGRWWLLYISEHQCWVSSSAGIYMIPPASAHKTQIISSRKKRDHQTYAS